MKSFRLFFLFTIAILMAVGVGIMPAHAAQQSKIVAGGYNTFALKGDGTLWAWGYNDSYGQLGIGLSDNNNKIHFIPVQIGTDTNWTDIAAGDNQTIALKGDGTLWAWGSNIYGQLGIGSADLFAHPFPVQIGMDTNWTHIEIGGNSIGGNSAFARKTDGTLWAWGSNGFYGPLGTSDQSKHYTPVQIGTDTNWADMAVGVKHTIARKTDGTLWAWGENSYGQLGIGSADQNTHSTPGKIGTDTNWTHIAVGEFYTIALKGDGTLWAWGDNSYGQLGIGSADIVTHPSPVQIGTDTHWADIEVGGGCTIARKTDGTLWSWGYNGYGQLGIGSVDYNTHSTPVKIGTDTNWVYLATAGLKHTIARKTDGTWWAWGDNGYGQLGDGTTISRTSPYPVTTQNPVPIQKKFPWPMFLPVITHKVK